MRRRELLQLTTTAALAKLLAGCDRFVVIDPRVNPELAPITPIDSFYRYQYAGYPDLDPDTHELVVAHEELELARFDRAFLDGLSARDKEHTLQCIGSSPAVQRIGNAVWQGLPLVEVLDALEVTVPSGAVDLRIDGADDYDAGVPIDELPRLWLVWGMNGETLPLEHGAPARLLVPGRYGVKNLKWITTLAFVDTPHTSFWSLPENGGWSEEATYRANALVAHPLDGAPVADGPVRFIGTAFAGDDPVAKVEVSVDGGPWRSASIDYAPGADVWALWSIDVPLSEGAHDVQVRCTTAGGVTSDPAPFGTDPLGGYDGSMKVTVYA